MERNQEKEIIERIKAGSADGLSLLLDRYGDSVFSSVMRIVGSREDAEELTQDVFVKVLLNIEKYRGESSLSTWIYRIAYNHSVSRIRKRAKNITIADETIMAKYSDEQLDEIMESQNREELLHSLEKSLKFLPPDESMLITMFYYEDKNIKDLALITGLTESNVKVKLHRIRKKLYICICEEHKKPT